MDNTFDSMSDEEFMAYVLTLYSEQLDPKIEKEETYAILLDYLIAGISEDSVLELAEEVKKTRGNKRSRYTH